MPKRTIESISYLYEEARNSLQPDYRGRFRLIKFRTNEGKTRRLSEELLASKFVKHKLIKNRDPVLTLSDGYKIRVYQGGDPSYMLAEASGIMDEHEQQFAGERKERETDPVGSYFNDWGVDSDF